MWCYLCGTGYSVGADLKMLMRSWPFVSDIVSDPERLVDLKVLDEMVSHSLPPYKRRRYYATLLTMNLVPSG